MRFPPVFGVAVGIVGFGLVGAVSLGSGASLEGAAIRAAASGGFLMALGWMAGAVMASAAGTGAGQQSGPQDGNPGQSGSVRQAQIPEQPGNMGRLGTGDGSGQTGQAFDFVLPPTSAEDLWQPLNPPKVGSRDPGA